MKNRRDGGRAFAAPRSGRVRGGRARWAATASLTAILAAGSFAWAATDPEIGVVFQPEYRGALGVTLEAPERELHFTDPVYLDEVVITGSESSTALQFLDETRLQVGANSRVVLDRYVYDPDTGTGEATISFGTGVFRFITGQMNKDAIELRTPTAVMAVRGTKLIILVEEDGSSGAEIIEGGLFVDPCGGEDAEAVEGQVVLVPADCTGAFVSDGTLGVTDMAVLTDLAPLGDIAPGAGPPGPTGPTQRDGPGGPGETGSPF